MKFLQIKGETKNREGIMINTENQATKERERDFVLEPESYEATQKLRKFMSLNINEVKGVN